MISIKKFQQSLGSKAWRMSFHYCKRVSQNYKYLDSSMVFGISRNTNSMSM
jgi:hypothetical protein